MIKPVTGVAHAPDVLYYRGTQLPVRHAAIVATVSGDNEVVAASAGYYILVLAYNFMSGAAVNAKWRSGTTDISGRAFMDGLGKGKVVPHNPHGWFKTAVGEPLNLNLSTTGPVEGELTYVLVPDNL